MSTRVFVTACEQGALDVKMRVLVVLVCFLAGCLAQRPHQCASPPLLTGSLTVSTQNEKLFTFANYMYDALGERIRLWEYGLYQNQSFTENILLLFKEGIAYEISVKNRTCKKLPLKADFQPLAVPKDASLAGQAVLGSSSGPGEGLLINTWTGDKPVQYFMTVTEFGCIPVSTVYRTDDFGWAVTSFFNNIIGIPDPSQLNPPDFCQSAVMQDIKPLDFFNFFQKKK